MADGSRLSGDHRITDTGMRISLLGLFIAKLLIERMGGSIEAIFIDNKLQIKITFDFLEAGSLRKLSASLFICQQEATRGSFSCK